MPGLCCAGYPTQGLVHAQQALQGFCIFIYFVWVHMPWPMVQSEVTFWKSVLSYPLQILGLKLRLSSSDWAGTFTR